MKRILNHFFQTLLLLIAVGLIFILPDDAMSSYVNWTILGLIILVLISTGYYLYRGRAKGLFSMLFLCALICPVMADAAKVDNSEAESYYKSQIDSITTDFCQLKNDFDVDTAIEDPSTAPNKVDIADARKYIDLLREAKNAGVILAASSIVPGSGTIYGGVQYVDNEYMRKKKCAEDFLEKVAEYIQKKYEANMTTIYRVLEADKEYCWPCAIVHLAMDAMEHICIAVEDKMKAAAVGLLGILFLFWILLKVLMLISQFGTADNGAFFTEFLKRAFLAIIVVAILERPMSWLYGQTLSPLIGITAGISQKFIEKGNEAQGLPATANANSMGAQLAGNTNLSCGCCNSGSNSDCNSSRIALIEYPDTKNNKNPDTIDEGHITNKALLSLETKRELLCMTCSTYKQTAPMVAAGRVLIYWSLHERTTLKRIIRWAASLFTAGVADFIPVPFSHWILGVFMAFCFTWLAFSIAFRFIDIFLRIGFAFLLTPLLVTCFVFPITRQYTKRGWDFLVHALLSMLALAMGISLTMSVFMSTLPNSVTSALRPLMQQQDATNNYDKDLYAAIAGGGFYTILMIGVILFVGLSVIKASQVIIEGLSGITSSIPSLSGAAVMAAIRSSLAPYRMVKAATLDGLTRAGGKVKEKSGPIDVAPSKATKVGRFTESGVKTGGQAMEKGGQAMEKGGQAVEKGGAAVGKGMDAAGKGATAAGQGMMQSGAALSGTGIGAVAGVPLMAAGAVTAGAGYGAQAAGKGVEAGSKVAGKGMQAAGKGAQAAGKATQQAAKPIGKAADTAANGAGKVKDGVQSAGAQTSGNDKSSGDKSGSDKAKNKKGSALGRAGIEAWDLADQALDKGLEEGDKSVEDEHMPEPEPEEPKSDDNE